MATTAVQAVEKNITSVALADIQPSNYNPRKNFDETSLAELAESIRQQGVLQPIGVRPIADNRFEIVFGERRYRASLMAELAEIPAIVMEISDETAEEMAITENLQRKDVTPIEEANAYQKLIDSGRHDVQSLTVQFGKTEAYISTRLKFVSLIPEIALLLEQDEITISVASEICRYGEEIQREVYDQHLKEGVQYNSWRGMKASEVAQSIERQYTADLNRYSFDKTLCLSCPHNTNNMMLFCEGGCGNCANRACLVEPKRLCGSWNSTLPFPSATKATITMKLSSTDLPLWATKWKALKPMQRNTPKAPKHLKKRIMIPPRNTRMQKRITGRN